MNSLAEQVIWKCLLSEQETVQIYVDGSLSGQGRRHPMPVFFFTPCSSHRVPFQDLEHDLGQALNEVQASRKTWFNRTLSSIKTVTGVQGKETC